MKKFWRLWALLSWLCASLFAAPADSVRVSLLTCAPGSEIYSLFGHTALLCENLTPEYGKPSSMKDWVFNYGMFNFNEPNFVLRFIKGETDYCLGVMPYEEFKRSYQRRGSSVYRQELNLTASEKTRLIELLNENLLPPNIRYRYNYFDNNCTTKARDKVEECIDGQIVYPKSEEKKTFRDIIHEYTQGSEWDELGIDLCLGSEADEPIDERRQMFAPFYMMAFARDAMIHRGDTVVPLVRTEQEVVTAHLENEKGFFLSPMACAILLLVMTVGITAWSVRRKKVCWLWDTLLFGAQGISGCIIAFLFFFSVHPTVGSNWMLVLLNPLPLLYLPFLVYKGVKGKKDAFHWVNVVYLTLFIIIMPFLQQKFNATVLPLTLSLLLCSVGHLFIYYRKES